MKEPIQQKRSDSLPKMSSDRTEISVNDPAMIIWLFSSPMAYQPMVYKVIMWVPKLLYYIKLPTQ